MSQNVGSVGNQDVVSTGWYHPTKKLSDPSLESVSSEIKAVLASLVRDSDKDLKADAVRPLSGVPKEDKFTALIKHILQEVQQILSGTNEKFMQCGNQPGQGPHHPPPQGPHRHGLPPVFKELQAATTNLHEAEAHLRSAQARENKMETALYGGTVPAESLDTKKAKKEVAAAQVGILKALLHTVEGLEGRGHGIVHTKSGEPVSASTVIDQITKERMEAMQQSGRGHGIMHTKSGEPVSASTAIDQITKERMEAMQQSGRGHGIVHTQRGEPVTEPTDIDQLTKVCMEAMQQFVGVAVKAKEKLHSGGVHGPHHPTQHVPAVFKELEMAVKKLESAEHKLHGAQASEDKAETKLYGAPVAAESSATTSAKKGVTSAKSAVVTALLHILEGVVEPQPHFLHKADVVSV